MFLFCSLQSNPCEVLLLFFLSAEACGVGTDSEDEEQNGGALLIEVDDLVRKYGTEAADFTTGKTTSVLLGAIISLIIQILAMFKAGMPFFEDAFDTKEVLLTFSPEL